MGEDGTLESWEYQGGTFTDAGSWLAVGGKKIVELEETNSRCFTPSINLISGSLNTSGDYVTHASRLVTESFILIDSIKLIDCRNANLICYYDSNKKFISYNSDVQEVITKEYIKENYPTAKFIRYCIKDTINKNYVNLIWETLDAEDIGLSGSIAVLRTYSTIAKIENIEKESDFLTESIASAYVEQNGTIATYSASSIKYTYVTRGTLLHVSTDNHNPISDLPTLAFSENSPMLGSKLKVLYASRANCNYVYEVENDGYIVSVEYGENRYLSVKKIESFKFETSSEQTITEDESLSYTSVIGACISSAYAIASQSTDDFIVRSYKVSAGDLLHITDVDHSLDLSDSQWVAAIFDAREAALGLTGQADNVIALVNENPIDKEYTVQQDGYIWVFERYSNKYVDVTKIVTKTAMDVALTKLTSGAVGKTMVCFGDSLTHMRTWEELVKIRLKLASWEETAVSGGTLVSIYRDIENANDTHDIITFWYGTNDWATSQVLGTISDMGTEESAVSFYGALNYCAKWFSEHLPYKNIIFITPLQRIDGQAIALGTINGLDDNGKPKNNNGNTLEDFVNAVIDVAQKWAIPCYDAHRLSNVNAVSAGAWDSNFTPTQYEDYEEHYTGKLLYDGLHYKMGSKGAAIFANKIANFIADNM